MYIVHNCQMLLLACVLPNNSFFPFHSLRERQESWRRAEEERIASLPDPSIPPGHALMPKTERLNTLELLHTSE